MYAEKPATFMFYSGANAPANQLYKELIIQIVIDFFSVNQLIVSARQRRRLHLLMKTWKCGGELRNRTIRMWSPTNNKKIARKSGNLHLYDKVRSYQYKLQ